MINTLTINPLEVQKQIVSFIRDAVDGTGFSRVVLGLSGGVDSAVSGTLAVRALGAENVFPVMLPYGKFNEEVTEDARIVIKNLEIPEKNVTVIDIQKIVDQFIGINLGTDNLRKGNIIARMRMTCLFDLSKKYHALVLGTENKTEKLLGYYTRFGDSASDIEPIAHLYKTQVRQLAEFLEIPERIIRKAPTAGLWEGQTDEGEFGFSYEEADEILFLTFDRKLVQSEIINKGFLGKVVLAVLDRARKNGFKKDLPYRI